MDISKKWDKEYSTQFFKEVEYLKSKGIRWTFVKTYDDVRTYKYTKTKELFETLAEFYEGHGE